MPNPPYATLVMSLADPSGNPRPNRVIHLLSDHGFLVDVLSFPYSGGLPIRRFFPVRPPSRNLFQRIARRIRYASHRFIQHLIISHPIHDFFNDVDTGVFSYRNQLAYHDYSLIVVEDLKLLPLAFRIKGAAKILFDAREYYPRQAEDSLFFKVFERRERIRLCRKYLPLCDEMITVSPGLAEEYQREFQVSPTVIMSTPKYHELSPKQTNPKRIRMVHHGVANRNRTLENMIDIARFLDERFTLDFYLTSNPNYVQKLKGYAKNVKNVRFQNPVPFDQIIPMLSEYDIGIFYVEPTTFNLLHCLPNKVFEFIQARLAVAIGPSPDMARIVRERGCGAVADSFSVQAMADLLIGLNAGQIDIMKNASHRAAKTLCYDNEGKRLIELIHTM